MKVMLIHRLQLAGSGRLFSLLAHLVRGDMLHSAAAEDGRRESMLKKKEQAAELPEIASAGHLWWSSPLLKQATHEESEVQADAWHLGP